MGTSLRLRRLLALCDRYGDCAATRGKLNARYLSIFCKRNVYQIHKCAKLCGICNASGTCAAPVGIAAEHDASDCAHVHVGHTCNVTCGRGWRGAPAELSCRAQGAALVVAAAGEPEQPACADIDECASKPCLRGACLDSSRSPRVAHGRFECHCPAGFTGELCESKSAALLRDPCISKPCLHGGSCVLGGCASGQCNYTCRCANAYSGSGCARCADSATWANDIGDGCAAYAKGEFLHELCGDDTGTGGIQAKQACPLSCEFACGADSNECLSQPCQNGGSCVESTTVRSIALGKFECRCLPTWGGALCTVRECKDDEKWASAHGASCQQYARQQHRSLISFCSIDTGKSGWGAVLSAKQACPRACEVCGTSCHMTYGADMLSLGNTGDIRAFAGLTAYLDTILKKDWDLNRLCGDFYQSYRVNSTGSLCGKSFDVLRVGTNHVITTVTVLRRCSARASPRCTCS